MNLKSILVAAFVSLAGMSMPATADHGHGDEKAAKDAVAGVGVINSINKKVGHIGEYTLSWRYQNLIHKSLVKALQS